MPTRPEEFVTLAGDGEAKPEHTSEISQKGGEADIDPADFQSGKATSTTSPEGSQVRVIVPKI